MLFSKGKVDFLAFFPLGEKKNLLSLLIQEAPSVLTEGEKKPRKVQLSFGSTFGTIMTSITENLPKCSLEPSPSSELKE